MILNVATGNTVSWIPYIERTEIRGDEEIIKGIEDLIVSNPGCMVLGDKNLPPFLGTNGALKESVSTYEEMEKIWAQAQNL